MLEQLLMQAVEAQSLTELIVASGALLATVGGVITAVVALIKSKHAGAESHKAIQISDSIGQYATTFGQKTVEQEERIKNIGQAIITLSPDTKKFLEIHKMSIDQLIRLAEKSREQLEILDKNIPETAKANNIKDLPR